MTKIIEMDIGNYGSYGMTVPKDAKIVKILKNGDYQLRVFIIGSDYESIHWELVIAECIYDFNEKELEYIDVVQIDEYKIIYVFRRKT